MGPGHSKIQANLARRIIRHGAAIRMMRPDAGVVVVSFNVVHLVLRLHVSVFGYTHIDPDSRLIDVGPVETRMADRFIRSIDSDATRASTSTCILSRLKTIDVKLTNPRQSL